MKNMLFLPLPAGLGRFLNLLFWPLAQKAKVQGGTRRFFIYSSQARKTRQAFCPPSPKELESTTRTRARRACPGT